MVIAVETEGLVGCKLGVVVGIALSDSGAVELLRRELRPDIYVPSFW